MDATQTKIVQPMTQYDAAKKLVDAAVYTAAGLGFTVKAEFENTVPLEGSRATITEGIRDSMSACTSIVAGVQIDPRELMIAPPTVRQNGVDLPADKKLILPE